MSQMTAAVARVGVRAPQRRTVTPPSLRVVTGAERRPGPGFAILCMVLLTAGLMGLLLLNTSLGQGAFALHDLQATSGELSDTQDALAQQIATVSSPSHLAQQASAMGMVPSPSAAFLRVSDGAVFGVAKAASKQPGFTVVGQVVVPPATSMASVAPQAAPVISTGTTTMAVTVKNGVTTTVVTTVRPDGSTTTTTTRTKHHGKAARSAKKSASTKG